MKKRKLTGIFELNLIVAMLVSANSFAETSAWQDIKSGTRKVVKGVGKGVKKGVDKIDENIEEDEREEAAEAAQEKKKKPKPAPKEEKPK